MVDNFLNNYFDLIKRVNNFHFDYLVTNKFKFPKTNYLELKRFIDTATNFLNDIDPHILDGLGGKLYQDVTSLYSFYKDFEKKSKYKEVIFYKDYLESIEYYKNLKNEYENLKKSIEEYTNTISIVEQKLKQTSPKSSEYKKLKKIYVDSVYELSKNRDRFKELKEELEEFEKKEEIEFFPKFNKLREMHLKKLELILSVKLYYFDKLLWYNASKSELIRDFFCKSNIEGDFSTKTFIKYFLKNIDISKSYDSDWVMYLQKILKVVE